MKPNNSEELKDFLEAKVREVNVPDFIPNDPILIPHSFKLRQDIEISAFWTAMLSWGQSCLLYTSPSPRDRG